MTTDGDASGLPTSPEAVAPRIATGVARGRLLFNQADFWGCHEALEEAWLESPGELRSLLQGLIQAAASFHKLVVQDNPVGARRLLRTALLKLDDYPGDVLGLALDPLRSELREWLGRLSDPPSGFGPVIGLPRLEWSPAGRAARLSVDSVAVHEVEAAGRRAMLVSVSAGDVVGWGECRLPWDSYGVWDSLVSGLVPALLSEPVCSPGELPLRWAEVARDPHARAGLEAAAWDAWARQRRIPLCVALGNTPRPVPVMGAVPPGDVAGLAAAATRCIERGYRMVLLPARPNADRRVLPILAGEVAAPFALEMGASYRTADIKALRVLDELGATLMAQPVPVDELVAAGALGRWLETPISMGGWTGARHLASALDLIDISVIHVEPSQVGLSESIALLDVAAKRGVPAWVRSDAATAVGAAAGLAAAAHEAVSLPSVLTASSDAILAPPLEPNEIGAAQPPIVPGCGVDPDPVWLESVTTRHAVLRG